MQKIWKKWGTVIIIAVAVLLIVILGALSMISLNKYKKAIVARDEQISTLETSLNNIGPLVTGYVVTRDVRAGELIEEDDILETDIPQKLSDNIQTSIDDILGAYYRTSLSDGTVLTKEDVVVDPIDNTEREYDLVIDEWPIGLKSGDKVDVRIAFSFGEDFVAMSNKQVIEINSGIPKVYVTESDITAYNSMLLDKALYAGAKIYAVKYKDPGSQAVAEVFYPINKNIAELTTMNPNMLEMVKEQMKLQRNKLDANIGGTISEKDERELERLNQNIEQIRNSNNRTYTQAQTEWNRRMETAAREAELAAQG